ncbi:MAG: RNA pseudouridine synthase [Candidatus Firestonebacteria bacterium GWA2_43_8]|nr:MAG: RNA pseudouridine synthase [Candidatus Firestonebacteria bacterium GWA2_43_8]
MQNTAFFTEKNEEGKRIDVIAAKRTNNSRAATGKWIDAGSVLVNGRPVKASYKLKENDAVIINIPKPEPLELLPENIFLDIVYEDSDIIVINKPAKMVVHPAAGVPNGTLVNALLFHCNKLSKEAGEVRPGLIHRLDKDTSGAIAAAKNDFAHRTISKQFKDRKVDKLYTALVWGKFEIKSGYIDVPIGRSEADRKKIGVKTKKARDAYTEYKVIEQFEKTALLEIRIKTGRTHQIRVHLAHIRHPVVGDAVYGKKDEHIDRQALHCSYLSFLHPVTGKKLEFKAELPEDIKKVIRIYAGKDNY